MLLLASNATERIAWDMSHHAYYPGLASELEGFTTRTITSQTPVELEYFRNIEFLTDTLQPAV